MKQLILGTDYTTAANVAALVSEANKNTFGFYDLKTDTLLNAAPTKNFCIALSRGTTANPFIISEVDVKSLTVEKSTYVAPAKAKAIMTINEVTPGSEYTIIVAKKGVVRHERNTWTATTMAKDTTVATVVADLIKQFNASTETSGVKATASGGAITIEAVTAGTDYEVIGADELTGVKPTGVVAGTPGMLDKAYVQDLASRCAAGKGFNLTAEDAHEMYPGYPETVADTQYTMYTLRFAVPRVAAKQRDEVVYQVVHLVLPSNSSKIGTLDTIFGTTNVAAANAEAEA